MKNKYTNLLNQEHNNINDNLSGVTKTKQKQSKEIQVDDNARIHQEMLNDIAMYSSKKNSNKILSKSTTDLEKLKNNKY